MSSIITPLDQHGSTVILGNNLTVPLDFSVLYIRPMYVTSSTNPCPAGATSLRCSTSRWYRRSSTAHCQVLGANINGMGSTSTTPPSGGTTTTPPTNSTVAQYLKQAATDYTNAQAALSKGDLGLYQQDVNDMNEQLKLAQAALSPDEVRDERHVDHHDNDKVVLLVVEHDFVSLVEMAKWIKQTPRVEHSLDATLQLDESWISECEMRVAYRLRVRARPTQPRRA